jgi:glycosyltransferase involved in cell wall biosynthesis
LHAKVIFAWEKFFLPKVKLDKLIVWTENMKNKYCIPWGIPAEKIIVMPAALNEKNYRTIETGANGDAIKQKFGEHLITSIKGLWGTNAKGLEYIIKAMKFVKEKHPEYKYIIFGWGERAKELQELAEKEGVSDVVVLAGPSFPGQNESIAAATEISPHSYVYEFSTSISLLEYMAWGKAMVVTNVGAVKEFVGDSAIIVEPENPKAIAEGIIKLIENKKLRIELEKKARQRFLEKYSIKASVDLMEKEYEEAIKNG